MKSKIISFCAVAALSLCACADDVEMRRPPVFELPDLPTVDNIHRYKAPLYWSVYEYCYTQNQNGVADADMDLTSEQWDEIIDWVASDLKPYGYDMVCTDGFIPMLAKDESGYMTHYGSVSLRDLVAKCEAKGLKLGVYDNPLWIHGATSTKIEGTDYTFQNLFYNGTSAVTNPSAEDKWFWWVSAENPGAKEYIDGFFKHYSEMGIKYIRMDFLSWYEDGRDRNMGVVGRGYGRTQYARALSYIAEAADKYGVFTSLVMPHLYEDAALEAEYGHMVRIVADTGTGGWWHCAVQDRGKSYANWPNCMNMYDGFTYWGHIAGRDKVILDGDFIRLNTFNSDDEKQFVVSLQLLAGGPVTVSDQPSTIGNDVRFYTNTEMLALNADRFVGQPLSSDLNENYVWHGAMTDGSYIVGIFNRNDSPRSYNLPLTVFGLTGKHNVRDLWTHVDEPATEELKGTIPAHGCKIVRLSK